MKTSNKLMLGALVVLLVSLTIYDFTLKAEYLTGNYKNPYKDYISSDIKSFNEIEINATNMINITIRKGDYAIHTAKSNEDILRFTKVGNRLIINVDFEKNPKSNDPNIAHFNKVDIYCPNITYVKTNEHRYTMPMKKISQEDRESVNSAEGILMLRRFKLDSLNIEHKSGTIFLGKDTIGLLRVTTAAQSNLNIEDDVYISKADMHINDQSTLRLEKFNIPKFNYTLADSATITFTSKGATLKDLINKL